VVCVLSGRCRRGRLALPRTSVRGRTPAAPAAQRPDESTLLPQALEIFDFECRHGGLSLATLQRVHAHVANWPAGIGGRLRAGAAVVRLGGLAWLVPPPAAIARLGAETLVSSLATCGGEGSGTSAAVRAADVMAHLTGLHPFPDGNGRVARALATWLLVRAGYRCRPALCLGDFCRIRQRECFHALRHHETDPSIWREFFAHAASTCFIPASLA